MQSRTMTSARAGLAKAYMALLVRLLVPVIAAAPVTALTLTAQLDPATSWPAPTSRVSGALAGWSHLAAVEPLTFQNIGAGPIGVAPKTHAPLPPARALTCTLRRASSESALPRAILLLAPKTSPPVVA